MDPSLTLALRGIFVALHILFVVFWLMGFAASFVFRKLLTSDSSQQQAMALRMAQFRINNFGGAVGGPGVLVTGLILLGLVQWGFLGFGPTPLWLFIKQLGYVISLVLFMGIINPNAKKIRTAMDSAADSGNIAELQSLMPRMMQVGTVINIIIIVNVFLAAWGARGGLNSIINWFG